MAKMKVYAVGVGPGNPEYITERVKKIIGMSDIIIGYRYTINTIRHLIDGKDVRYVTLSTQEDIYAKVAEEIRNSNKICTIPFTGDANFSESEIIDRLREIFGDDNVLIEAGISSIQVAASRSKIPLDKSVVITFHITGSIEREKKMLIDALKERKNVILLPRPWDFMPRDISLFLKDNGIAVKEFDVEIYERLTLDDECITKSDLDTIPAKEYSDLSVMVIKYKSNI